MWLLLLLFCIFLIIMSVVWFIFIRNPVKLQNLTWFYGYTPLILGVLGILYFTLWKLKMHDKALDVYDRLVY